MTLSKTNKVYISVLGSQLLGGIVATPGAVYCAEKLLPHQMGWLKKLFADHIVLPHLAFFEKLGGGLDKAHTRYDERKQKESQARGEIVEADAPKSKEERALSIASVLVKGAVALTGDVIGTIAVQRVFDRALGVRTQPFRTNGVELGVQLGAMAMMPTLLAGASEHIHHTLRRIVQKMTGMSKESAHNIALPITYLSIPGLLGTAVATVRAQKIAR